VLPRMRSHRYSSVRGKSTTDCSPRRARGIPSRSGNTRRCFVGRVSRRPPAVTTAGSRSR
jgi:hypothetical protein